VRVKQDLKPARIRLISRIMAPPLPAGVGFQSKGVRGRSDKGWPALIFFKMAETIESRLSWTWKFFGQSG
jgi:hypothetical protein